MESWKCKNCNKYISVDLNRIKKSDEIYFKLYDDGGYVKYAIGLVLFTNEKFFFLETNYGLYRVLKSNAYPKGAPVYFIYNMFGVCFCEI